MIETEKQIANAKRTSIYIDEALVRKAEILYGLAGVSTFSQFVRQALEAYINQLVLGNHGPELPKAIRKALADEVKPIAARLSKSLYRYAIELDMLTQIIAYGALPYYNLDQIRKEAKLRVEKMQGRIDVQQMLKEKLHDRLVGKPEAEPEPEEDEEDADSWYEV